MRKLLAIILTIALVLCALGCSKAEAENSQGEKPPFSRATYDIGSTTYITVIVDHETGVNYIFYKSGYGGGLSPRYNPDGTLYITEAQE